MPIIADRSPTLVVSVTAETHQYLLCTVAVGRSYVQDDPAAPRSLPASYDSLYLHIPEAGAGDAAEGGGDLTSGDAYRHTYVVFDAAQVIPRYVVHFAYHPRERLLRQPVKPINLAEIKARVADALSLLGPAAPAATEKMLSDIGAWTRGCGGISRRDLLHELA
jgi:hypothetical protein